MRRVVLHDGKGLVDALDLDSRVGRGVPRMATASPSFLTGMASSKVW